MTLVTQEDSDFTNIFRTSKNGFIQFAYSYLGNMQDAEDVVMESYIQYWENKDKATFQTSNIKGYIFTIIRNRCIDILEERKYLLQKNDELYKHTIGEIELNISSLKGCDPSELFTSEIENIVNDTIKTLPNRTREIFYERYLEQKSYKTIGRKLRDFGKRRRIPCHKKPECPKKKIKRLFIKIPSHAVTKSD